MISSLLRSHETVSSLRAGSNFQRSIAGTCMALAKLIRREEEVRPLPPKKNCYKEGINLTHSLMNCSGSPSGSFMKEITGLTFLHFPFTCECLLAQRTCSLLTLLLSAPLCLLSRALLLPPDSQVLIRISSDPPLTPLALHLNTFTIPALLPLISTLRFTFSRILAFLSNSSKPNVVRSIIRNTVTVLVVEESPQNTGRVPVTCPILNLTEEKLFNMQQYHYCSREREPKRFTDFSSIEPVLLSSVFIVNPFLRLYKLFHTSLLYLQLVFFHICLFSLTLCL